MQNYIKYNLYDKNNISREDVINFLELSYKKENRFTKLLHKKLYALQNRIRQSTDINLLFEYAVICKKIGLQKKSYEICHAIIDRYKKYNIIELLGRVPTIEDGSKQRTFLRHRNDFFKYIAYNITASGYTKDDINELLMVFFEK